MEHWPNVDDTLAIATRDIVREIMPEGFQLCDPGPGSLEECTRYFQMNGKIGVDPGFVRRTSIFADADTHHAFQAWHDWCHVKGQCTFDIPGERRVDEAMQQHLARWWVGSTRPVTQEAYDRASEVLRMHNLGRLEYWLAYGEAPDDPRAFLYGYLTAKGRILIPRRCNEVVVEANRFDGNEWTTYL